MTDRSKPSEFDSLSAEIDNAVEDLFSSYQAPQKPVSAPKTEATQTINTTTLQTSPVAPTPPKPAPQPHPAQAQPTAKPSSSLAAEIDRAVDDLFGAYETPKPAPAATRPTHPASQPPAVTPPSAETPKPPPSQVTKPAPANQGPPATLKIEEPAAVASPRSSAPTSALSAEIDKAVDDLFGAYESPKPAPPKQEVQPPQPAAPAVPAGEASPSALEIEEIPGPELENETTPFSETVSTQNLWALLDQAFLTVDWEVTSANVRAAKRILDKLRSELRLGASQQAEPVLKLMDEILAAMASIPESVPTTGSQAMQEGLLALKAVHESDPKAKIYIENALTALKASLPDKVVLTAPAAAPGTLAHTVHSHLRILAQCIKSTSQFEKLFSAKPAYQKLLNAEASLRQILAGEADTLKKILKDLTTKDGSTATEQEALNFLYTHGRVLKQCISKIAPLETLFSKKPAHHKLLAAHQKLRALLEKQLETIAQQAPEVQVLPISEFAELVEEVAPPSGAIENVPSISSFPSGGEEVSEPEVSPMPEAAELRIEAVQTSAPPAPTAYSGPAEGPEELVKIIRSHVTRLEHCKSGLLPLENLFVKPAQEKIRSALHHIRSEIESQMVWLSRALAGDYQSPPEAILQSIRESKISQSPAKPVCPWKNLLIAEWRGKKVAFIPSEVAYEGKANGWIKTHHEKIAFLPIRRLKKHFWSKLGPLFRGEMKFLGETYLKHMEIPMLNHVGSLRIATKPPKKPVTLVLFNEGYGGAVLLDASSKSFPVSKSWAWEPINQRGSVLAGHLTVKGMSLPVITISRLG